jgi:ArsR family transcriptional regulator
MDSAALLDLLGNENRRRILRLLARRPCYVTEISEALGVSPKAVIDHLRKLEETGLIESRVDEGRRKYFRISRNLRLEVSVSPYGFGAKSAYLAGPGLDLTSCRHLSIDVSTTETGDTAALARDLRRLEELERELSLAQRWVHGRRTAVMDRLTDRIDEASAAREGFDAELARLAAEVLSAIDAGADRPPAIAERVRAPPSVVADVLGALEHHGLVRREGGRWRIQD